MYKRQIFEDEIRRQVLLAIDEADVILFLVEVRTGITDLDMLMADILRRTSKKVILVCNKVDNNDQIYSSHEFYALGLGDPFCISSMSGSGTGDLMDAILDALPVETVSEEDEDLPHITIVGRPNVGKSSLINLLTGHGSLAKVSGTPGKTRLINHFLIDNAWYLVDLPGYGYARTSKTQRDEFAKIITDYVLRCERMHFLFVLVDSRLEPQKIDLRFIEMLGREGIPFGIVFTKIDKLSAAQLRRNLDRYRSTLLEQWEELPPIFCVSSADRRGREEILAHIEKCLTDCS